MPTSQMSYRLAVLLASPVMAMIVPSTCRGGPIYNDWNYAIDAPSDGSGAAHGFEFRGLAYRELDGTAYFAVSSGMPLGGIPWGGALNNNISYGDLFLNFSSHNLDTPGAFTDPGVLAIRFDSLNDSLNNLGGSVPTLGVFTSVTPVSKTLQNSGYGSLQQYYNYGFGASSGAMGDLATTTSVIEYLGNGMMDPNIASGTIAGDVNLLTETSLSALGLDFGHFGADPAGNHLFGFAINSGVLPRGASFTAHLFYECINDGVALYGVTLPDAGVTTTATPEPGGLALAAAGIVSLLGCRYFSSGRSRTVRSSSS